MTEEWRLPCEPLTQEIKIKRMGFVEPKYNYFDFNIQVLAL
jgi:hypothetical protein